MSRERSKAAPTGAAAVSGGKKSRAGKKGPFGRLLASLWNRGATEATLLIAAAAVASGVVFGAGVARATSQTSDGQTWVSAGDGTIVQINPVTGQPVSRLATGVTGTVSIQQGGGVVLVSSPTSGQTVSIDVGQLVASAPRTEGNARHKWLLRAGKSFIVNLDDATIRAVDPTTGVNIGESYVGDGKLADTAIDASGTIWALGESGSMTTLTYSTDAHRFITDTTAVVDGAGPGSTMVPHARGVTVISAATKAVVQIGTGRDRAVQVPSLEGTVQPADYSPRDLTAITIPDKGSVIILDGDNVREADMASAGCDKPGKPAVFADKIYVPCQGKGRTVVLDRTGRSAGEDIITGTDDTPQITVDDDAVVVASSSAERAVSIDTQGRQHETVLRDKKIPVRTPRKATPAESSAAAQTTPSTPTEPPASSASSEPTEPSVPDVPEVPEVPDVPEVPSNQPPPTSNNQQPNPSNSQQPDPTTASSTPAASTPGSSQQGNPNPGNNSGNLPAATDVNAEVTGARTIQVSWTAPNPLPKSYLIRTLTGAGSTEVSASATTATVSAAGLSGAVQFVVVAKFQGNRRVVSAPSNVVNLNPGDNSTSTSASPTAATTSASTTTTSASTTTTPTPTIGVSTAVVVTSQTLEPASSTPPSSTPPTSPPPVSTPPTTEPPTSAPPVSSEPPTSAPPVSTPPTSEPPTSVPPVSEPPTTTTVPDPVTTQPAAPAMPNLSLLHDPRINTVQVDWTAEGGATYELSHQLGTDPAVLVANPTSGMSVRFTGQSGQVQFSLTAIVNGVRSPAALQTVDVYRDPTIDCMRDGGAFQDRPICPTYPTCDPGTGICTAIPLRDSSAFQESEPVGLTPVQRYGSAAGLVALAGLITLTRAHQRRRERSAAHSPDQAQQ